MNEPDLNHLSGMESIRLPAQLLLVLTSLVASLTLAGAAFGFSDQNADLQWQARERQEQQRLQAMAREAARLPAPTVVAQATSAPAQPARVHQALGAERDAASQRALAAQKEAAR